MRWIAKLATDAELILLAPVSAAEPPASRSVVVDYPDLDLVRPEGLQTLLERIDIASRRVCGKRPTYVSYGEFHRYLACRELAMSEAVQRIDNPAVLQAWPGSADRTSVRLVAR